MEFEELQAIWETQIDAPAFSMNDLGLHLALHQQRQQSRRRLFWTRYFPVYAATAFMVAVVGFLCLAFYFKTIALAGSRDFPMTLWDGAAFLLSAAAMMTAGVWTYLRRRRHEEAQSVVARSLREELDRNIAHLEFQIHPESGHHHLRNELHLASARQELGAEPGRHSRHAGDSSRFS